MGERLFPNIRVDLDDRASYEKLIALLRDFGVSPAQCSEEAWQGFQCPDEADQTIMLDVANPGPLGRLDPTEIGIAVVDPLGYTRSLWGLAKRVSFFKSDSSLVETELSSLLDRASTGSTGVLYHDGLRFLSSGCEGGKDAFILVFNALDEKRARRQASKGWRVANTLKRLGKALTMNQTTQHLCVAAVHELSSSADLAGVLLWVAEPTGPNLRLAASVGINRQGAATFGSLSLRGSSGSAPELVAQSRQSFSAPSVSRSILCSDMEGRFCYLKPGAVAIYPLEIGGKLQGVLELIGKEGDPHFEDNLDLFETISEHLALALNSAALYENAERGALQDALTGIANHRALQEFLHARLSEAARSSHELAVVMVDVDHFRNFNEEHGHNAGDAVLKLVAEALRNTVRGYDLAARYGGEEFTLILPGSGAVSAVAIAERARRAIEDLHYETEEGRRLHITASLGCSIFTGGEWDAAKLLKAADQALYEAKRTGRNRTVLYQGPSDTDSISHSQLIARLRPADREAGESLVKRAANNLRRLAENQKLSDAQRHILRHLLAVSPAYLHLIEMMDVNGMEELERASEFRTLLPHLQLLQERFDGAGPMELAGERIPVLVRALQVLLALDRGESQEAIAELGRFDPGIVAIFRKGRRAA